MVTDEKSEPESKKEWSRGLSHEVVFLTDELKKMGRLGTIVDCGAGEGRHSVYASEEGAEKVIAIEMDPEQITTMRTKVKDAELTNLEVVEGDVLEKLAALDDETADGVIDCGMSHCLTKESQREEFAALAYSKLKPGGLYSITHFSENETLSHTHYKTTLEGLKKLYPEDKWEETMPWQEAHWERKDGQKHYAYKAVLRKK